MANRPIGMANRFLYSITDNTLSPTAKGSPLQNLRALELFFFFNVGHRFFFFFLVQYLFEMFRTSGMVVSRKRVIDRYNEGSCNLFTFRPPALRMQTRFSPLAGLFLLIKN